MKEPKIEFIDDGPGKPVGINRFIGRRPILAFGNSDGDLQMLQWTAAGSGARLMGIVHHTDAGAGMGLRPVLARRQAGQGMGRGSAARLDGRRHEAGLESDLSVPEAIDRWNSRTAVSSGRQLTWSRLAQRHHCATCACTIRHLEHIHSSGLAGTSTGRPHSDQGRISFE
jgi:hypothetical protein